MSDILDFFRQKKPEDVFTPRAPMVNAAMYVARPEYETELRKALRSRYNIVIFGDSGCGKSWLYKKVFEEQRIEYETVDLSAVNSPDDADFALLEIVDRYGDGWREAEKSAEAVKGAMPYDVGMKKTATTKFTRQEDPAFYQLCSMLRSRAKGRKALVVFENLEHVVHNMDLVNSILSYLLALDDRRFASLDIQICLVGVPSDIKNLLTEGNRFQTISNRVVEISEITRMSKEQAKLLIFQGFRNQLSMDMESAEYCASQIIYLTDRLPQYLHDVCLQVAFIAEEEGGIVKPSVVVRGAPNWVETNARQSREFIEHLLGHGKKRTDFKSKLIFSVSKCETTMFYASDIEAIIRESFPKTYGSKKISVRAVLNKLSDGEQRLLRHDSLSGKFRIVSPKLRSVLRHCLVIDTEDETVQIRQQV